MNLSGQKLTLYALREAKRILAYVHRDTPINPKNTIQELKVLLTRTDRSWSIASRPASAGAVIGGAVMRDIDKSRRLTRRPCCKNTSSPDRATHWPSCGAGLGHWTKSICRSSEAAS
jgi:hypothetical protein